MVDNLSKISPSISSAERVKRVGREQHNNQQKPFKEALKDKEKKKNKKKDLKHKIISGDDSAVSRKKMSFQAVKPTTEKSKRNIAGSSKKIIDIRV
jgi:hypothetical protein